MDHAVTEELDRQEAFKVAVVIKVIRAELKKNFESFGRMDPYAVVNWTSSEKFELTKTRVDWNAHMLPVWEHSCRPQAYEGHETIEVEVREANLMATDVLCGVAEVKVAQILGGLTASEWFQQVGHVPRMSALPLKLNDEEIGTVYVQAMLVPLMEGNEETDLTRASEEEFETPVKRLGVSGGTAPFFALRLRQSTQGRSATYYIGKDLSRASDEVDFYEQAKVCADTPAEAALRPLLQFTFPYAGILTVHEEGQEDKKPLDLLVLRNLRDGCAKLRLLDIKIGQKTAQAGWQGKSHAAALRQAIVDGTTNSAGEGFRLEGFDGQPSTLNSMDPLLDLWQQGAEGKLAKKAFRVMLQRMTAARMIMYFLDMHADLPHPSEAELATTFSQAETAEVVLHETVTKLLSLSIACKRCPVPQKWIGSSVALGFDVGQLLSREHAEEQLRRQTIVNIFDWGRSELNTIKKHAALSDSAQADRAEYWSYYAGGIYRLSWEASRAYLHQFGNAEGWQHVSFMIWDFDSMSDNDFMGKVVEIPLQETKETTAKIKLNSRRFAFSSALARTELGCWKLGPTLTYSIEWVPHPPTSRLKGLWRVQVVQAENLPREDLCIFEGTSDPFVEVIATSASGFCFRQQSKVQIRTRNPKFCEVFELPVARTPEALREAFASVGISEAPQDLLGLLWPEKSANEMLRPEGTSAMSRTVKKLVKPRRASRTAASWDVGTASDGWDKLLEAACHAKAPEQILEEENAEDGGTSLRSLQPVPYEAIPDDAMQSLSDTEGRTHYAVIPQMDKGEDVVEGAASNLLQRNRPPEALRPFVCS